MLERDSAVSLLQPALPPFPRKHKIARIKLCDLSLGLGSQICAVLHWTYSKLVRAAEVFEEIYDIFFIFKEDKSNVELFNNMP